MNSYNINYCIPERRFFDVQYNPMSLDSLEQYIRTNKHLPDIPTETEVTGNGMDVGNMNAKLLQKVEELTLYIIELKKEMSRQQEEIETLKSAKP